MHSFPLEKILFFMPPPLIFTRYIVALSMIFLSKHQNLNSQNFGRKYHGVRQNNSPLMSVTALSLLLLKLNHEL